VIVNRVFEEPVPCLLTEREIGLVGNGEADNTAVLRIALLWDELLHKLDHTPTAALGLLDIANSGMVHNSDAIGSLEPALARAVRHAATGLPATEAWDFVGAIARKMQGRSMPHGIRAVADAAGELAGRSPHGAVALLTQADPKGAIADLLPSIARGIAEGVDGRAERALLEATPEVLGRLLAEGGRLVERAAGNEGLVDRLAIVLPSLDRALFDAVGSKLLLYLVEDWQLPAAKPLLASLNALQLGDEVRRLGEVNEFAAESFFIPLICRARNVHALDNVRAALIEQPQSERRDAFLAKTLRPTVADVTWLLNEWRLTPRLATTLLVSLLREASESQFSALLSDRSVGDKIISTLQGGADDLLLRVAVEGNLPIDGFVRVIIAILPNLDLPRRVEIAQRALGRCLRERFEGDEVFSLAMLHGIVAERLDGAWAARLGLERGVNASVVNRNMLAFNKAPQPARIRMVRVVDEIARVLEGRHVIDLNAQAAEACARLLFDAEEVAPPALLTASGKLLPMLMRAKQEPISLMIAAMFPIIYRELGKEHDVPALLKFLPFLDWDRCKAARQELVSAFMSSTWQPGDLALTACRCGDISRILRRTAKAYGGDVYINRLESDLKRSPNNCREQVSQTTSNIRSDWSSKYDWQD
jgi:hypothetical protein